MKCFVSNQIIATMEILLLLLLLLSLLSSHFAISSPTSNCNRTCGPTTVPYPFGFSPSCPIPLNCSKSADTLVGGFSIRNITSDALLIHLPPNCTRPIHSLNSLYSPNYAMTWRNGLFLRRCPGPPSDCVVPSALLLSPNSSSCDNITCVPSLNNSGFLKPAEASGTGCSFLYTSVAYSGGGQFPSLELSTAELGWWLEGTCRCSDDANCTRLTSPVTNKPAFRCSCHDGFQGDGFRNGTGCRRAVVERKCNPSKYLSGRCGGITRVGVLIGGIIAGAVTTAGLAFFCYLFRKQSSSSRNQRITRRLLSQASCTIPLYSYKDIERATNGFSETQFLGTGAYGTVYGGTLSNGKSVAIKKIKKRDADATEQVMNEIKLLSSVSHPNLVRLLGCCIEKEEQILIYEFMPNGTLSQHLQRERGPSLPWTVRLTIATETAKAIAYLHSAINPPIYHRDVKSSNILLDYKYNSKVADFGLSRMGMTELSHISTTPQGTPGYLDPQYHQNFHLSDKSDVYSFGVVLVEIISALKVVDFNRVQNEVNLAALAINKIGKGDIDEIIDPYIEPHRDAWTLSSIHKVAELAFRCLAFHRDMRPSMTEVADELEQIRLSGWAPSLDENKFMSASSSVSSVSTNCTDKSQKVSKSRKLVLVNTVLEEMKVDSPVSVHDPWFSDQSSPSKSSLLGNAVL
ncbi:wall-associated receptor kinase-like 14 isoform X1 [Typha latifolia]|uniref:wall-associated receptor kinase-like 14 isoform X1 n=1 Tax=Typha latifolia TaxID=4733 RepID=UPI003C2FD7E0